MPFEFDHLFILTAPGAPEAERLVDFGLTEGEPNTHPGQGTANRRFFFHNAMLELLWVHDEEEAALPPAVGLGLLDRWRGRNGEACPFGVCLRPDAKGAVGLPFPAWEYRPSYLPPGLAIHMATNARLVAEPSSFYMDFLHRPDAKEPRPPLDHAMGLREVTALGLQGPWVVAGSKVLSALEFTGVVRFSAGSEFLLEIGFDGDVRGESKDFRPGLPLIFHW